MAATFETIISVLDKFSAPILGMEDKLAKLGNIAAFTNKKLQMSPSEKLWDHLSEHISGAREGFAGLSEQVGEMGSRIAEVIPMVASFGGAASVAGLVEMTHATAEAAEALHNMAVITGTSMPQFQALNFAAQQSGVATDALGTAMERLNVNVGKAAEGQNKSVAALFDKMGISLRDANGHVRSAADLMPQLASAFEKTKDPALQSLMAVALFGKTGEQLIPFLDLGPAKIKALTDEFRKFGYSFSDEDAEGLEKFKSSWNDLTLSVQGLEYALGSALGPVLAPIVDDFAIWLSQNRQLISSDAKTVVEDLADAFKTLDTKKNREELQNFVGTVGGLINDVGGLKIAMLAGASVMTLNYLAPVLGLGLAFGKLGLSMGAAVIGPISDLVMGFVNVQKSIVFTGTALDALDLAISANPLGALILAATLAGGAAVMVYKNWGQLKTDFVSLLGAISRTFDNVFLPWETKLKPVFDGIGHDFDVVFAPMEKMLDAINDKVTAAERLLHLLPAAAQPGDIVSHPFFRGYHPYPVTRVQGAPQPVLAPPRVPALERIFPPPAQDGQPAVDARLEREGRLTRLDTGAIKAANAANQAPARPAEPLKGKVDVAVSFDGLPQGSQVSAVGSGIAEKPVINTGYNGTMANHRG